MPQETSAPEQVKVALVEAAADIAVAVLQKTTSLQEAYNQIDHIVEIASGAVVKHMKRFDD
jgi:hypothetical protein